MGRHFRLFFIDIDKTSKTSVMCEMLLQAEQDSQSVYSHVRRDMLMRMQHHLFSMHNSLSYRDTCDEVPQFGWNNSRWTLDRLTVSNIHIFFHHYSCNPIHDTSQSTIDNKYAS